MAHGARWGVLHIARQLAPLWELTGRQRRRASRCGRRYARRRRPWVSGAGRRAAPQTSSCACCCCCVVTRTPKPCACCTSSAALPGRQGQRRRDAVFIHTRRTQAWLHVAKGARLPHHTVFPCWSQPLVQHVPKRPRLPHDAVPWLQACVHYVTSKGTRLTHDAVLTNTRQQPLPVALLLRVPCLLAKGPAADDVAVNLRQRRVRITTTLLRRAAADSSSSVRCSRQRRVIVLGHLQVSKRTALRGSEGVRV